MISRVELFPGRYHDSVRLMQASKALQDVPGIEDALVAMATELNLTLLGDMNFDLDLVADAGANDLLLALRGDNEETLTAARAVLENALAPKAVVGGGLDAPAPKTACAPALIVARCRFWTPRATGTGTWPAFPTCSATWANGATACRTRPSRRSA